MSVDTQVADTILDQFGGMRRIMLFTGARHFVAREKGVVFKFPSPHGGPNHVEVTLDPSDTYTVTFSHLRGTKLAQASKHEGIYCDMLKSLFEKETGLYLSL